MEQERYINPYTDFGFKKLFDQAEIAQYSPEERREYEASIKNYWDYYSTMKTAVKKGREEGRAEGRAEGLEEGRAEGREEERRDNARKMKEDSMPTALIAKYTGLTEEEIEKL